MTRRKIIAAALVFAIFGVLAVFPPLVVLFRYDFRVFGVPVENLYIFALWTLLVIGARLFSQILPHDEPTRVKRGDDAP
ncbi:MAG: hypothetical protein M9944_11755 [Rhizobiaceae bacterium]|nr:hypothetical protein [Rhizobiaceae bacterium]